MRQRTKFVQNTRTAVSGGKTAADVQRTDELKAMKKESRQALLKQALGKDLKITVPVGDVLAMKADLGATWYSMRKIRR